MRVPRPLFDVRRSVLYEGAKYITMFVYCADADLHSLVNNNTMTQ